MLRLKAIRIDTVDDMALDCPSQSVLFRVSKVPLFLEPV